MIGEESDTYQYILEQGQLIGAWKILLRQGRERFGEADENVRLALESITNLEHLKRMSIRLLQVSSWQELLQTP
ncbi:MAG TPA: hypothetical protein VMF69_14150 [Gemmataceae bacterium]|nr:hypothetical protein [Gemmataceae bacterium]